MLTYHAQGLIPASIPDDETNAVLTRWRATRLLDPDDADA